MLDRFHNRKRYLNGIFVLAFILTPLISAILFCLKDGRMIWDIYIPLGGWSDEITYYKQIEGILSYGLPRGYFGYNQSRALYGSLAVWGLIPLIPYVVWGFFFGWNYISPVYANIFFCVVAFSIFCKLIRPPKKWMGAIMLFWLSNQFINRYVLSGVVEASMIAQLMIVVTCGEYLLSKKVRENRREAINERKDKRILIFCTVMICFLTLARPYYAVFFLIPLWKAKRDKNRKWMAGLSFLAMGIMGLFFLNSRYFCSSYFSDVISFEKIQSVSLTGILESLYEIAKLIWYAMRYKGSGPGWYYLLLGLELAAMICACLWRKYRHNEVLSMFLITLVGDSLILLSIIVMYDLGVGARHVLALIIVNAFLLILETHPAWGGVLAAVCILFAMPGGGISLDFEEFYDNPENIKAKYILVHPDGKIRKTLEEKGMRCVFSNDELMLYMAEVSSLQ